MAIKPETRFSDVMKLGICFFMKYAVECMNGR
jgi:hypothetical protein